MADASATSLEHELLLRLAADYPAVSSRTLYSVFADAAARRSMLSTPAPTPGALPVNASALVVKEHLACLVDALLSGPYSELSMREVNRVFAAVAVAYDKHARRGAAPVAAPSAPVAAPPAASPRVVTPAASAVPNEPARAVDPWRDAHPSSRVGRETPLDGPAVSAADAAARAIEAAAEAIDQAARSVPPARAASAFDADARSSVRLDQVAPPTAQTTFVRGRTVDFALTWHADTQTAELVVQNDHELERLALALRDEPTLELPLEPEPMLATAVLLKVGLHYSLAREQVRAGVREVGRVTELDVMHLPPELARRAHAASVRPARSTTAPPTASGTTAPPEAGATTPFDFGLAEDSSFKVRRGANTSELPTPESRSTSGRAVTAAATPPPVVEREVTRSDASSAGDSHRDAVDSALPMTEEERLASRRRRSRARKTGDTGAARRVASQALGDLTGRRVDRETPLGGTPAVDADPRPGAARRREVARRVATGDLPAVSEHPAPAPPIASSPRPSESGFFRRDSSATRQVTEDTTPFRRTDSVVRRHSAEIDEAFLRDPSSFRRRTGTQTATRTGGVDLAESWSQRPQSSMHRAVPVADNEVAPDEVRFGTELGADEGTSCAAGPSALLIALASRWPTVAIFAVASGARWRVLLREDQVLALEVEPEPPRFLAETLLRESGLVSESALQAAVETSARTGVSVLDHLAETRTIRHREADALQVARWRMMLEALFATRVDRWEAAGFDRIDVRASAACSFAPMAWVALVERVDALSQDALDERLHDLLSHRPRFVDDARLTSSALGLDERERKFIDEVLQGDATAREALSRSPLRRRQSMVMLVALDEVGLIDWQAVQVHNARVSRALPLLEKKQRELASGDVYAALESHWSSDERLLFDAWARVNSALDLETVLAHGTPEQRALATAVRDGLVAARDQLRTAEARAALRNRHSDAFERSAAVQLYEKQAEMALFKRDVEAAEDALRRVVELNPKDATSATRLRRVLAFQEQSSSGDNGDA